MDLPSGTVTFLFSDIEGSTQLLQALGDRYAQMLDDHQRLLRAAWTAHGGSEVNTQGDSFFVAFPTALAAVTAAIQVTRALAEHAWPDGATVRARVGLHTGAPRLVGVSYIGLDVHRAARIAGAGHGGQVLLSRTTRDLVEHEMSDGMSLRDLGTHRLKDLPHPEHLYQLVLPGLPAEFAPLKTLETRPHNLPVQPTPLIGREEAVATLAALLRGNGPRLVTLTGPGGIGKTRLSIQVAAELMDAFADGVWFMRLSRLSDPALVLPTIAQTLGLKETSGQPLTETLRAYLRGKDLLLLLDNFEQVVAAATDVAGMLEAGPRLKVLVTSRIPLRLRGEKAYRVAPLSLAASQATQSPMRLAQYSAVALFIQRAQEATADFALTAANAPAIAEICARLDGLPLAIELAAARVRLLPPEALLGRLSSQLKLLSGGARDLEARQRTMRATIGWSEDLLTADERTLFRRLAVFAGGWTLEAAEAVCMAPAGVAPLGSEVLECLATLVDHGLARQQVEDGEARFGMLHIIREYALERLEISGEAAALCQAHLASVLALAERAARHYRGPREAHWLAALEREHDNVRAALGWTRAQGLTTAGLRLAGVMARFWDIRGYLSEGREWLESLLALALPGASAGAATGDEVPDVVPDAVLARALYTAGDLAVTQGDCRHGLSRLEQCLPLARAAGDQGQVVQTLNVMGIAWSWLGDNELATRRYEEALEQARAMSDPAYLTLPLNNLGEMAYLRGDLARAAAYYEEALAVARQAGDRRVHTMLCNLGNVARRHGQLAQAGARYREALALAQEYGDPWAMAIGLEGLAMDAAAVGAVGQRVRAVRLLGAAAAVRDAIGAPLPPHERAELEAESQPTRAALGEDAWHAALAAGRAMSLEEAVREALGEAD